jgi:translation initiation factor 1
MRFAGSQRARVSHLHTDSYGATINRRSACHNAKRRRVSRRYACFMSSGDRKVPSKSSPFAALAALRDDLPQGPTPEAASEPAPASDTFDGKVVVSRSKKGRGGKTVTTIAGVRGDESSLEALAHDLRKALGCGATVDDAMIVVQGDQVTRVRGFLEARGARRVIVGS